MDTLHVDGCKMAGAVSYHDITSMDPGPKPMEAKKQKKKKMFRTLLLHSAPPSVHGVLDCSITYILRSVSFTLRQR